MTKIKKILLVVALIAILATSMLVLTGCGEKETATTTSSSQQASTSSSESSEESTSASSSESSSTTENTVIQVPMTVVNQYPNLTITGLYLSGAGQNTWGSELLGGQTMPTGTQLTLTFNIDKNNVKWDMKAVDENGVEVTFAGIDLSNVSTTGGTITLVANSDGAPYAVAQ